jgi:hypothetical protein
VHKKDNRVAQQASGFQVRRVKFGVRPRPMVGSVLVIQNGAKDSGRGEATPEDWRRALVEYILEPSKSKDRKIQRQALRYTVVDGALY